MLSEVINLEKKGKYTEELTDYLCNLLVNKEDFSFVEARMSKEKEVRENAEKLARGETIPPKQ